MAHAPPAANTEPPALHQPPGWREVRANLRSRPVLVMLAAGFASGLPFLLTGTTLGFWLREAGQELATIGFLSWVGLFYSLKLLWAPALDRLNAPLWGQWLGRRRGWLLWAQMGVGVGLSGMALTGPQSAADPLWPLACFALLTAFASATQDIVADAWRIEMAQSGERQALFAAAFQLGYRAAQMVSDSLILILAAGIGWQLSYQAAAAAMLIGLFAIRLGREPAMPAPVTPLEPTPSSGQGTTARSLWNGLSAWRTITWRIAGAIIGPFQDFFRTHGERALLILLAVSLYRLPDFLIGPVISPFYVDVGLDKATVGAVRATLGLWASLLGIAAGGLCALRFGFVRTLALGAALGPLSNLGFSVMAFHIGSVSIFSAVIIVDNFSASFAGTALVAYMSSLTGVGYTAAQYALLSSFYALLGKFLKGFSGQAVDSLLTPLGLMPAYALFFASTAAIGLPTVWLCILLTRASPAASSSPSVPPSKG
jgi:MFS transporter, PAT family, beta-lactamase induction signal transducer AmpG